MFPMTAITNYHRHGDKNRKNLFCHSSGSLKSRISIHWIKIKVYQSSTPLRAGRENLVPAFPRFWWVPAFLSL